MSDPQASEGPDVDRQALIAALAAVGDAASAVQQDFRRVPFFVRPMVQGGFARRTGRSPDAWYALVQEVLAGVRRDGRAALSRWPRLRDELSALAENFRTAGDRGGRMMGGERLAQLRRDSAGRERAVRAALEALDAAP